MRRPTSVTVFSVINIILCVFGVIGFVFYLATWLDLWPPSSSESNPIQQLMEDDTVYQGYMEVVSILGLPVTIVLLAASIGMLQFKPWARLTTIGWGVYMIAATIIGTAITYMRIWQPLLAQTPTDDPQALGYRMAVAIGVFFSLLSIAYAALMIVMLNRSRIRQAFEFQDEQLEPAA